MCVVVCDRYAIARAPTESMKIKRDCSSPSEVKDALECHDATRRNEIRPDDAMRRDAHRSLLLLFGRRNPLSRTCQILSPFIHSMYTRICISMYSLSLITLTLMNSMKANELSYTLS